MGDLSFFTEVEVCENARTMGKTEVSRSHSSEEAFVMRVERRAESSKQGSFF